MNVELTQTNDKRATEPWSQLPENVRRLLEEKGTFREYDAGAQLMAPGDLGELVRYMLSGHASVLLWENGLREISVDRLGPGDVFGEISFLTGRPAPSNSEVVADEDCRLVEIPAAQFAQVLGQSPELAFTVMRNLARKVARLERSVFASMQKKRALKSLISREHHIFPDYVIGDYVSRYVATRMGELAGSDKPVLIAGETGVGKEVLGHAIFKMSRHHKEVFILLDLLRAGPDNPFEAIESVGAGAEDDLTREQMRLFFGSRDISEDGPSDPVPGYVELSEEGTLLVRGVDQLTATVQEALLEAAATGTFRRPGGEKICTADFRLIATTELELSIVAPEKHPLINGLAERSVTIAPLRKRRREIPLLVDRYLALHCRELRKEMPGVPRETLRTLLNYSWPGNDLELSATLKRALLVAQDNVLRPSDIYFQVSRIEGEGKLDLLKFRPIANAIRSPLFPAILQSAVTPFFFILMALLFLGPQDPLKNPASLFSWALGWPALVGGAFLWARFWCTLCPMGTLGMLAKKILALEKPFPTFLKNHSELLVVAAVLFIIWLETATNMRNSPFNVGLLIGSMAVCAVLLSVYFERMSWCRYLCPLGNMTAVLAKTSILEMRADQNLCASQCKSPVCFFGTETREGCPYGQVAPTVHSNLDCKLCGTCVKNCPHGAISLNLRVPGQELLAMQRASAATAFLVLSMLGGLVSEMVNETPVYAGLTADVPLPTIVRFTITFAAIVLAVNVLVALAAALSHRLYHDTFQENYARFGMALLPLTLASFLAFHTYYLINLGVQLPILVSQNLDLAIFRQLIIKVPPETTFLLQQILVWAGMVWSLLVIYRLGRGGQATFSGALAGMMPHILVALALTMIVLSAIEGCFYGHPI